MLTPCRADPDHTARPAARVAPATSADASCMPANTGLSSVPRPNITAARSWAASGRSPASRRSSAERPAAFTAAMYAASCTSSRSASVAGTGLATVTPGRLHSPNSCASRIVSSMRTGAIGWPGPKSYPVSRSSRATCKVQVICHHPCAAAGQDCAADEVLDEVQRPARGGAAGVGDPARPERSVRQLALTDDAPPDLIQRRQRPHPGLPRESRGKPPCPVPGLLRSATGPPCRGEAAAADYAMADPASPSRPPSPVAGLTTPLGV